MSFINHPALLSLAALTLAAVPVLAHEGHQQNMTDGEMAQMQTDMMPEGQDVHRDGDMLHQQSAMRDGTSVNAAVQRQPGSQAGQDDPPQTRAAANRVSSTADLLGRLHPAATHFPIALLLTAALAEVVLVARPALGLEATVRFLVAGGAIGAVIAALLGWFAAGWRLTDRSDTLALHRWNGTGIAVASVLALWLATKPGSTRTLFRSLLFVMAAALFVQGYYGGEMVFGPNHMGIF